MNWLELANLSGMVIVVSCLAIFYLLGKRIHSDYFEKNMEMMKKITLEGTNPRYKEMEYGGQPFFNSGPGVCIVPKLTAKPDPTIWFHCHPTQRTIFANSKIWTTVVLHGKVLTKDELIGILQELVSAAEIIEKNPALLSKKKSRLLSVIGVPVVLIVWAILVWKIFVVPELERTKKLSEKQEAFQKQAVRNTIKMRERYK